jgi:hypothetical protein
MIVNSADSRLPFGSSIQARSRPRFRFRIRSSTTQSNTTRPWPYLCVCAQVEFEEVQEELKQIALDKVTVCQVSSRSGRVGPAAPSVGRCRPLCACCITAEVICCQAESRVLLIMPTCAADHAYMCC